MNTCPTCGESAKRTYCSRQCWLKVHNSPERNRAVGKKYAKKIGDTKRGTGKGEWYLKRDGRHEHRTIAEEKLGRKLHPGEIVHHIDGNKRNNDPSNLYVFASQADHSRHHMLQRLGRI